MPLPRRRSSFLGQQVPLTSAECLGSTSNRVTAGEMATVPRASGVYVSTVPTGGFSTLGTRVSRRALGISSVFLQGIRSSCHVPLRQDMERMRSSCFDNLSSSLVDYIGKVRALDHLNTQLEDSIRVYLDKKASKLSNWATIREEWDSINHQVSEAILKNARFMLQTENNQAAAEDFKNRYENEQAFRKAIEDEINSLYKVIDDAVLTKTELENQTENLKDELEMLSNCHEEDVRTLYNQLAGSQLEDTDVPIGTGLDDILEAIRTHWEKEIERNRTETNALMCDQPATEPAKLTEEEEAIEALRKELNETGCRMQSLQAETESLRALKRGMENSLYDAKHWHDIELQNLGSVITKLETELSEIRGEVQQQQRDNENLLSTKMKLEKEIEEYHRLLEGEASRL
ncbi:phakinin [Protopterus annectens]|uniref:phakinin n=1 Tax=Protopterus annectens TaxID=7888 RepID=UPI001CF94FFA|nr:phakinin [Protopterus annectens]